MAFSKIILNGETLMDATTATAEASDITAPKTALLADGQMTTGTGSGGTTEPEPLDVNFIDYDGKLLHAYTATEFSSMEELPSNPTHEGLTAQGWNLALADIKSQLQAVGGPVWVGQMYITDDGKTRIYVSLDSVRLHPYLGICPNGTVTVDWGDNTTTDTLTGSSLNTVQVVDHAYVEPGDYKITLTVSNGSFQFSASGSASNIAPYILRHDAETTGLANNTAYASRICKIELGANAFIGNAAFSYCSNLLSITIPQGITSIGAYAFYACHGLKTIIIPDSVTQIGDHVCSNCPSLTGILIPAGVTTIADNSFVNCSLLKNAQIPDGVLTINTAAFSGAKLLRRVLLPDAVTTIGNMAFYACHNLLSMTIPANVTSIGTNVFSSCYNVMEYHFLPIVPPTLAGANSFASVSTDCIFYVPYSEDHSILEAYQTATNWSTYASQMQEEPQ